MREEGRRGGSEEGSEGGREEGRGHQHSKKHIPMSTIMAYSPERRCELPCSEVPCQSH